MTKMTLSDKLKVLVTVSQSSKLLMASVIVFLLFLAYLFFTTNKKNAKTGKKIYLSYYFFILIFIIITYGSSLTKMFDYMMNNFFIALYFPNLAIYLAAIIATNIILWVSVFSFKTSKAIKNINITIFCIINYLLALLLNIITSKKIDVFSQESIYANKNAQALIELSSLVFIVWIIFLVIYRVIRAYQNRNKNYPVEDFNSSPKLPTNIIEISSPVFVRERPSKKEEIIQPSSAIEEYEKMLTLDDYKIVLNILKEQKEKERLEKIRKEQIMRQEKENKKYNELQNLYKVVK